MPLVLLKSQETYKSSEGIISEFHVTLYLKAFIFVNNFNMVL